MVKFLLIFTFTLISFISSKDLYRLNVSTTDITVSGISGGAFFSVQFGTAYSSLIKGVGSFAGGPYYCAANNLMSAFDQCMDGTVPMDMSLNVEAAQNFADMGWIDPVSNVQNQNVWVFSGIKDTVVVQSVGRDLASFYELLSANLQTVFNISAEHGWVTNNYGSDCPVLGSPYIQKCTSLNAMQLMFTQLYNGTGRTLNQPTAQKASNLFTFDQTNFGSGVTGLQDNGYWYVPSACAAGHQCSLHLCFHGCKQSSEFVGTTFVQNNEVNGWAEANNIIVLYPQVETSSLYPYNPEGCFDWWGYTDTCKLIIIKKTKFKDYPTQEGTQMSAVREMIQTVAGI